MFDVDEANLLSFRVALPYATYAHMYVKRYMYKNILSTNQIKHKLNMLLKLAVLVIFINYVTCNNNNKSRTLEHTYLTSVPLRGKNISASGKYLSKCCPMGTFYYKRKSRTGVCKKLKDDEADLFVVEKHFLYKELNLSNSVFLTDAFNTVIGITCKRRHISNSRIFLQEVSGKDYFYIMLFSGNPIYACIIRIISTLHIYSNYSD